MSKKPKLDGTDGFIQEIKNLASDSSSWGWLMVFFGVPFIIVGMFLQEYDWHIYLSYFGGFWVIVGFIWGAFKS